MREEPGLTSEFIDLLSQELANTRSQITVLNRRSAIEKLAAFVLNLWRRQSMGGGSGTYNVGFETGEVVSGEFHASSCPGLATYLATPTHSCGG